LIRPLVSLTAGAVLVVGLASVAVAAGPNGATGHGAEVSAVAKAVHTTQGNAHGKAVSAIASAHGKEVSAAARARAAANKAAGKANGAGHSNGKGNQGQGATGAANSAEGRAHAPKEPGRIKTDESEQPESPSPS
jgi:hypothetical protein